MRANESPEALPPEAVERQRREAQSQLWGNALMGLGALIVLLGVYLGDGSTDAVTAIAGIVVMSFGGMLRDPANFRAIVERAIDALPGGKN